MSTNEVASPRSRKPFWVLIGVFFAPLLIAFALYYGLSGWRPAGSTHHGDLIDPARPLPEVSLRNPAGADLPDDLLKGKWTLVYIGAGQCDTRCRDSLVHMRQTRLALGDDMTRIGRVFLATGLAKQPSRGSSAVRSALRDSR